MGGNLFLYNGSILASAGSGLHGEPTFADSMLVVDGKVAAIGSHESIVQSHSIEGATLQDLEKATVLPSFIDGHMHLLLLGQSLRKLDLGGCRSLDDIRSIVKSYAQANPGLQTILCKGWMVSMTPGGVTAAMLDDLDPRPIFIDEKSLHSCWCNTAALQELGAADLPDPVGGKIHRDADGKPSGLMDEGAMMSIIWPHQARACSTEERMESIMAAIREYSAAGYTGVVEMAMDEEAWDALVTLRAAHPDLPMRVAAHWLIRPTGSFDADSVQVQRAIELSKQYNSATSPDLRIVGVKLICDGIIDACTAFLSQPYAEAASPPPIWLAENLNAVVKEADAGGLQIALHAIGDAAIKMAVDAIEKYGTHGRRHRIEHLELASAEDAKRLGALGLTASIQPVHADPAILKAWPRLLGKERCGRAFAYREFADAGALMAIGSDSPTAAWAPMPNIYVATTRRSAKEPESEATFNEHFRLGMCEALLAATQGAARSVFAEERTGSLGVGKLADFIVVDLEWNPEHLLKAKVRETWFQGMKVWEEAR